MSKGLPIWLSGKESACQCRRCRRLGFDLWVRKIPWSSKWQPTLVFLPGKSHGQKNLEGYSPWGRKESDMTEHACMHVKRDFTVAKTNKDLDMWRLFWIIKSYEFLTLENISQLRSERDVIMEEKSERFDFVDFEDGG